MPIQLRPGSLSLGLFVLTTSACIGSAGFKLGGGASSSGGSTTASAPSGGGGSGGASSSGGKTVAAVPATKFSDFGYEVKESTGDYHRAWVIDKLTKFEVGNTCMEKMLDKENGALHAASFYTRDITDLAEALTGDDWSTIESQNNNDRETNKKFVEPMIDRFKASFAMTIAVEGDDCDARQNALWLRYWTTVATAIKKYPPASGKVFVSLAVRGDARDVKVIVDEDTSTYTITAPRDIESYGWSDKLEKPFRKRARQK